MPIKIPQNLPAIEILAQENIFVMDEKRAVTQDIRPLKLVIINLMPTKIETETQLLRLLSNSPLQIEITFLKTDTYTSQHISREHMEAFYKVFDDIKTERFDGLIITGAPVEHMEFEEVQYWKELVEIMEWSKTHVYSTLYICWAAQAGLYHHFGVPKYPLDEKLFGVFPLELAKNRTMLLRGFDEVFNMPHSRHTEIREEDILKIPSLQILAKSDLAGVSIVRSANNRMVFVTGHVEYDRHTLAKEYERDVKLGRKIEIPYNYYPNNDPSKSPIFTWRAHANLLFTNWINYYVYQETPYNLEDLENIKW